MEDSLKAQQLVKRFIWLLREYEKNQEQMVLDELNQINADYSIANGGGDLFKVSESSHLRSEFKQVL